MKRIEYSVGEVVGQYGVVYLKEVMPTISKEGVKRRVCEFLCSCGNKFVSRLNDVRMGKTRGCNCKKGAGIKKYSTGDLINGVEFVRTLGTSGTHKFQKALFKCPFCGEEWESLVGNIQQGNTKSCCRKNRGWTKTRWTSLYKKAYLYKVILFNAAERFVKIGITSKANIKERFGYSFPYSIEVIKVIEGDSGYIFDLEIRTKKLFKRFKYTPLLPFKGEGECYYT